MKQRANDNSAYIHYLYKITNNITGEFYYGIHSTSNINDGYMGSGVKLKEAYNKYGVNNFTKDIIDFFDSRKECLEYERLIVNEDLIHNKDCYNIVVGGNGRNTIETVTVKDKNGKTFQVSNKDERWLSGEYMGSTKNTVLCFKEGGSELSRVNQEEFIRNRDKYKTFFDLYIPAKLIEEDKYRYILKEEYNKHKGIYVVHSCNKVLATNGTDNFMVDKNDERLHSGELKLFWKDRKHKEKSIVKLKQTLKEIGHQQGDKNSQYGKCWITNGIESKSVKKENIDEFLKNGWRPGRVVKKKTY